MAHESIVEQARQWIDRVDAGRGLSNNWRLQVIQKRYRKRDLTGTDVSSETGLDCDTVACDGMPLRIRRFVPGCPWALVDQAIRYLICKAPYTGLIYNGLEIPGTYRPTLTMWQRDEQSTVDEANPKNGTYTLIQDLIQEDCDDEETLTTEETCSYVETTEFHWDDSSPGELPGCGSGCGVGTCQGVTYALRTQRNKEDGTFDWTLVTRRAKTQHFGPYNVECNDCTAKVTQEIWDNVYGNAEEGFRFGPDCTDAIEIPKCDSESGVHTQVQIQQKPDCTFQITVTRRESIEYTDEWTDGTSCRTRTVVDSHNLRTLPKDPKPQVGEVIRVTLKRNDDCTYDYNKETSNAPDPYSYSWDDGNDCRPRTVTVYKDQKTMPKVPTAKAGETVDAEVSRNQDCTWDAKISVRKPATEARIEWDQGSTCRPEHVVSYQNSAKLPSVPTAKRGQVVTASLSRNDDCTYNGQITVRDGLSKETLEWKQGSKCRVQRVTRILNATEVPAVPTAGTGQTVNASISRNEDCTYDAQITVEDAPDPEDISWTEGSQCKQVESHHLVNQASYSIPKPSKGQSVSASVSKNADCTYDVNYKIAQPYSGDEVTWTDGTWCKPRHHTLWIDQAEKPTISSGTSGQTVDAQLSFDPSNCTWSGRQTITDAYQGGANLTWTDGNGCQKTHHTLIVDSTTMPTIPSASDGQTVSANLSFNDSNCTWNGRISVTDAPTAECMEWTEGTKCQPVKAKSCVNQKTYDIPEPGEMQKVSAHVTRNADCTYNYTVKTEDATPRYETTEWDSEQKSPSGLIARYHNGVIVFRNQQDIPKVPKGVNASVSFTLNEFCLYDGQISWSDLYEWYNPASAEGGIRNGEFEVEEDMVGPGGRPVKITGTYDVICFIGSGNEGTEAEFLLRGYVGIGGGGGIRAYRSPKPKNDPTWKFT